MLKTKRLAILCFLLLASVSSAVVAHAAGVMQSFSNTEKAEIDIQTASVTLILTPDDRQKVTNIVLLDSQIQELLEGADNYTIEVSEIFGFRETASGGIELIPKEGVAQATIEINNDYGEEFGVQVITVIINLENEEITEIKVNPENRKLKVNDNVLSPSELVKDASKYDGVIMTVSGKVSLLGEVFGYLFMLDEEVTVFYRHEEATIDVSNIENGDAVTVTGKFVAPDTIYAIKIEKN
jgi:hypothetical protein